MFKIIIGTPFFSLFFNLVLVNANKTIDKRKSKYFVIYRQNNSRLRTFSVKLFLLTHLFKALTKQTLLLLVSHTNKHGKQLIETAKRLFRANF